MDDPTNAFKDGAGGFVSVSEAVSILLDHGIVALPTETVYGLAACVFSELAVRKVFMAKGRPANNPLIVHVHSIEQAQQMAWMNETALHLSKTFWPGPLTLVLPSRGSVPDVATGSLDTVAVRMPRHATMLEVIRQVGQPLVAPSANKSGYPSPTKAQHVLDDYQGTIPVVDGGPCTVGLESTVVAVNNKECVILRPGFITANDLRDAGCTVVNDTSPTAMQHSPGTRYKHYTPHTPMRLLFSEQDVLDATRGRNVYVLAPYQRTDLPASQPVWNVLSAETLYAALRDADALRVEEIIVLCTKSVIEHSALMDRLRRATGEEQE